MHVPQANTTIVVEARKDDRAAMMLDSLADACEQAGYRVKRWRGPLSGRMPYSRWLPDCEMAILFNGTHEAYREPLARLRDMQAATLFVELGWHPQAGHYQVDSSGVNAAASWCREPLPITNSVPPELRAKGDLLVLLQLDGDTQITRHSPWFGNMQSFVQFLARHSQMPVRVRPHPLQADQAVVRTLAESYGLSWDENAQLSDSLSTAKAVACINSSAAVLAMEQGLPVLCYGEAVYRHAGAVYRLTAESTATERVTLELQNGKCSLSSDGMASMVARIQAQQWRPAEASQRLPPLIAELLASRSETATPRTSVHSWQRTLTWLNDMPARVLYRHRLRKAV
jgi:Capsule polysaccharide biosynthesis protein